MSASIPLVRQEKQGLERSRSGPFEMVKRPIARLVSAHWFRCAALGTVAMLVHSPALQGQRIWDDHYLLNENPFIKSPVLLLEMFRHHLFLDSFSAHYRPAQNISLMVDYFFWNTNEFGFHLTNVILHAGSGILLYFLLRYLFGSLFLARRPPLVRNRAQSRLPWIGHSAFLISLLWVVHPVHSAAVDYISGRADSLAFFFAAAGWLLFLKAQNISRPTFRFGVYGLAAASGLVALLSREIVCVWIVLFIAHVIWFEKGILFRRRLGAVVCCLFLFGIYVGLRQLPEQRPSLPPQTGWSAPVRGMLVARALGDYARLMIFPANLHMERSVFEPMMFRSNSDWRKTIGLEYVSVLGLVLLAFFAFGVAKKGRGQAVRILGASWFLAAFLPISNIVQLNATVAEHWLYLPSVGFLIFLAGFAVELRLSRQGLVTSLTLLAVIALGVRSFVRSSDWSNEETFDKRTLAAGATSGRVAVNLAQIYVRRGDYVAAEKILRHLMETSPDYPTARNTFAALLSLQGKKPEAEAILAATVKMSPQARRDYPRTWWAALTLAQFRHEAKDDQAALAILKVARADYPNVWDLIKLEAELRRQTQGPAAALPLIEDFARENWWHYGATLALGKLYAQEDDPARAEGALRRASLLDVHDAEALRLLAVIRLGENRLEEACRAERRAIARQPDEPSHYFFLSNILEQMGRNDEAHAALAQVARLRALVNHQPVAN
jgi:Flp pilus assembly protein TadD